ncbi:hypothetical protein [Streptomyces sp. NPDC004435]|uniref:hypothetical protein n=1 Tax=Streptomyces sp. NPDC004435 TaxID=3364701 RepID=UPI0036C98896
MKLKDLSPLMKRRRAGGLSYGYDRFRIDPAVAPLQGPDEFLEQFHPVEVRGRGRLELPGDLAQVDAAVVGHEVVFVAEVVEPTGASDAGCIGEFAENLGYRVGRRAPEVGLHWEGTGRGCGRF